jgi:hypothetical protein
VVVGVEDTFTPSLSSSPPLAIRMIAITAAIPMSSAPMMTGVRDRLRPPPVCTAGTIDSVLAVPAAAPSAAAAAGAGAAAALARDLEAAGLARDLDAVARDFDAAGFARDFDAEDLAAVLRAGDLRVELEDFVVFRCEPELRLLVPDLPWAALDLRPVLRFRCSAIRTHYSGVADGRHPHRPG